MENNNNQIDSSIHTNNLKCKAESTILNCGESIAGDRTLTLMMVFVYVLVLLVALMLVIGITKRLLRMVYVWLFIYSVGIGLLIVGLFTNFNLVDVVDLIISCIIVSIINDLYKKMKAESLNVGPGQEMVVRIENPTAPAPDPQKPSTFAA